MSLNGLDDPKIKEAHETAVAEPGGWFLLKYTSRDEIDLLGKGNGGIVELRNEIAKYEEPSPLFGFIRYRRRNVVIKYVPEECSRLVQARVQVHFNAVTEQFSHNTVFPITSAKELKDTKLSAACSLHTASGSISSSTSSLRRRRLMEIAEEEEEESRVKRQSTVPEERPSTGKTHSISGTQAAATPPPALPELPPSSSSEGFSPEPSFSSTRDPEYRPRSPTRSIGEPRKSSQSTRPEIYSYSSYGSNGRRKVKLGPRPSLDTAGRPHTSAASTNYRPVSTLPEGLKIFSRSSTRKDRNRPKSQYEPEGANMPSAATGAPDFLNEPHDSLGRSYPAGGRPTTSSGVSTHSAMLSPAMSIAPTLPGMTSQRAKLLKAQELRQKKMNAAIAAKQQAREDAEAAAAAKAEEEAYDDDFEPVMTDDEDDQPVLATLNGRSKVDLSEAAFDAGSTSKTDESDATRSDSYPVSPIGASEHAGSTKASSISESTDETIQDRKPFSPAFHETTSNDVISPVEQDLSSFSPVFHEMIAQHASEDERLPLDDAVPEHVNTTLQLPLLLPTTYSPVGTPRVVEPISELESTKNGEERAEHGESAAKIQVDTSNLQESEGPSESTILGDESSGMKAPIVVSDTLKPAKETKEWNIPRSKFSLQNLKEASASEVPTEPMPVRQPDVFTSQKSPVESNFSIAATTNGEGLESSASSVRRRKRKSAVGPIRTDMEAADFDDNFSSDDELMDELQSAVVQEAKPISVSKSPMSPQFPAFDGVRGKENEPGSFARAFSNPIQRQGSSSDNLTVPTTPLQPSATPRAVSASSAYLNRINAEANKPVAKKVNLGSGISRRIKALEKLSSSSPDPATASSTAGSAAFFSVRKTSVRGPAKSPMITERANSLTGNTPSPLGSSSRESTPDNSTIRDRSPSVHSRWNAFKSNGGSQAQSEETSSMVLKQSPLSLDHQTDENTKETLHERRMSKERRLSTSSVVPKRERRSSVTALKDLFNDARTSFSEHRRSMTLDRDAPSPSVKFPSRPPSMSATKGHQRQFSIGSLTSSSRKNSGVTPQGLPTSTSVSSMNSGDESEKEGRKSNRASRMLSRMSRSLAQAISPNTVKEEFEDPRNSLGSPNSIASPTQVGISDVNVQFPDTLLWKRRSMFLDTQGYLIMAPALSAHNNTKEKTSATRRFHMTQFKTPHVPDVEAQELPNSIVLNFFEGGALQIACEDRAGQGQILTILVEAHRNIATL